jgi:colanic acid biosynthesis glycosyl transferase WcaI
MIMAFWGIRGVKQKPDYLFVESPPLILGITGYWVAKRWKIPFIFNVADLWPDTVRALGLIRKGFMLRRAEQLEAWLYRQADFITVVTEQVCQLMITQKQVPADKVLLLPNGVDTDLFQPQAPDRKWQAELGLPIDKYIILYAGKW